MERSCAYDGCTNYTHGTLCSGHWRQQSKGKPLTPLQKRSRNKGLTCSGPDCDRGAYSRGLCEAHRMQQHRGLALTPIGSTQNLRRKYEGVVCRFDGCDRQARSDELCYAHAQQFRRLGELHPIGWRPPRERKVCAEESCDLDAVKRGLCATHYRQWWRAGRTQPIHQTPGRRVLSDGYVYVKRPGNVECRKTGGWGLEHRVVMADLLGRALHADESVHHRNGDREDNRPENLELWSRWQPVGQRVDDKVAYAKELLARYAPDVLREAVP